MQIQNTQNEIFLYAVIPEAVGTFKLIEHLGGYHCARVFSLHFP